MKKESMAELHGKAYKEYENTQDLKRSRKSPSRA